MNDEEVRDHDWKWKLENKSYADAKRHAKPSCIDVGDEVLLKQKKENKLTTEFEHVPYQVIERNGNSVTVQSPGKVQYRRNVTEVRKHYKSEDCMMHLQWRTTQKSRWSQTIKAALIAPTRHKKTGC